MPVILEKARVNLWNIVGFGFLLVSTGFGWGITYTQINAGLSEAKAETTRLSSRLDKLNETVKPYSNWQFQTARALEMAAEAKQSNDETNKRIDRVVDQFTGKLDAMIGATNALIVKVEVLNNEIRKGQK